MNALFQNRAAAGNALAELLRNRAGSDAVVFGIGNGGTLVAAELARCLAAPLDLLVVHALNLPFDKKMVLGAVAPGGACVLNDELVDSLDVETDAIDSLRARASAALRQRDQLLRGGRPLLAVNGRTAILVEEAVDTDLRIRAAMLYLRQHERRSVVVAATVMARRAHRCLRSLADYVAALAITEHAPVADQIYTEAPCPGDAEVRRVLGVNEAAEGASLSPTTDD